MAVMTAVRLIVVNKKGNFGPGTRESILIAVMFFVFLSRKEGMVVT